jgi:4-alpha-glucanotransferase
MKVHNPIYNPKKFDALFGQQRMSGIFLHPTSLPSKFGIGDLGKNAQRFIDYLHKGRQKIWQILPLGPTGYGNSPYQCFSAFAGNHLLISLANLIEMKLLKEENLEVNEDFPDSEVDFEKVENFKNKIFMKAYSNFKLLDNKSEFKKHFKSFQEENSFWLKNFSVFMSLKELHNQKPWFEWKTDINLKIGIH